MIADRFSSRGAVAAVCLLTMLWPSLPTFGQSVSAMGGKAIGADPEVVNAAQAAEEALKSAVTEGEATRGASGAIGTLLIESDTLICSAWIISFRVRYRDMVLQNADPQALRAMQNLMEKVEKACEKALKPRGRAGAGATAPAVQPAADAALYTECPECDPLKRALDQRTYEYQRAEYELYQAMRRTDFVDSVHRSNATPQGKGDAAGETSAQAERAESRKRADVANAKAAMERAKQVLVECLERCHTKVRGQYGLLGGPRKKVAVGAGALVAGGVVALASSGGGAGSASSPAGGGASAAAPAPAPAPTAPPTPPPDPASLGLGICDGSYRAQINVSRDRGEHRRPIGMPPELVLNISTSPFQVRADPPWVSVNGDILADGSFTASGAGVVAGRPNVSVRMDGRLTGCSETAGTIAGSYSMGVGGDLPGGQAITYTVNGSK